MLPTRSTTDHESSEAERAIVEQAKGALMLRYGVGSYESLAALARWAHEAHVTVSEVAHALVKGICQGRVTPETEATVRWLEHRLRADIGEELTMAAAQRRSTAAAPPPTKAPQSPQAPQSPVTTSPRQWRYASAVNAARALGSP